MFTHPVLDLKATCRHPDFGIWSIAALAAFICIGTGLDQKRLAELTEQGTTAIGQWINLFELRGLIECRRKGGRNCVYSMDYTEAGRDLLRRINEIFKHES